MASPTEQAIQRIEQGAPCDPKTWSWLVRESENYIRALAKDGGKLFLTEKEDTLRDIAAYTDAVKRHDPPTLARVYRRLLDRLLTETVREEWNRQRHARSRGGRIATEKRERNRRQRKTDFLGALEDYERSAGFRLRPDSPIGARKQAADRIGCTPDHLLRLLKSRAAACIRAHLG